MNVKNIIQPEGNYYDKYNSSNPIVKLLMKFFFEDLDLLLDHVGTVNKVLEVGCGEGEISNHIRNKYSTKVKIDAFDISEKVIEENKLKYPDIHFFVNSIYNIKGGGMDLVICSEVLEHLEYPVKALTELKKVTNKYLIISVPREPIWRCLNILRGKYLNDWGNTPGHVQHWGSRAFLELLTSNGFEIIKIKKPLPWLMVLVRVK